MSKGRSVDERALEEPIRRFLQSCGFFGECVDESGHVILDCLKPTLKKRKGGKP